MGVAKIRVEVVHARAERQCIVELEVPAGATARDAVLRSRICERFPDLDPATCPLAICGRLCDGGTLVRPGDRVEIHRPLPDDAKAIRRRRAREQAVRSAPR